MKLTEKNTPIKQSSPFVVATVLAKHRHQFKGSESTTRLSLAKPASPVPAKLYKSHPQYGKALRGGHDYETRMPSR